MKLPLFVLLITLVAIVAARPDGADPAAGMSEVKTLATAVAIQGDVDCDEGVSAIDALLILRHDASVGASAACIDAGDTNCDDAINAIDALRVLRFDAGLTSTTPSGCIPIGGPLVVSLEDAAHSLAQGIVHQTSLVDGVHAVEEALSLSGVANGTLDEVLIPAADPAASEVELPIGTLNLALEARGGTLYRMTAAEVGQMLADFEWPFAAGSTPGQQVVAMLTALINGAHDEPDQPVSFAPLLLHELLLLKEPPLDLTADTPAPEDVRLSLLDLKLLTSLYDRVSIKPEPPASAAVPAAVSPCTAAKDTISGATGPFGGQIYGLSTSQTGPGLIDAGLGAAGVSKANAASVGQGLAALGIAAKIWKLIEFYSTAQVNVTLDDSAKIVHKAPDTDAPQLKLFKGVAGVSEEDWQEYVDSFDNISQETNQAVRDCLNEFGLTVPADLGEIAKDAENWKLEWSIRSGFNYRNEPNAFWSIDTQLPGGSPHLGHWKTPLTKVSDYSAEAAFIVDIGTELTTDHPGPQKLDNVEVCADVDAASPPSLGTFFNATQGILGLIDAIVDLGAGWLQTVAPPRACAVIGVTYHEYCALMASQPAGTAEFPASQGGFSVAGFDGLADLPCEWTGTGHGDTHHFITGFTEETGTIDVTFTFGRPQIFGNEVYYEVVGGSATWQASGHIGSSCNWSDGGTEAVRGHLAIFYNPASAQMAYSGVVGTEGQDRRISCSGDSTIVINTVQVILCSTAGDPWLVTGPILSGNCVSDHPMFWHDVFNWDLNGISCPVATSPAPAGTCGGQ